jgi:hypothetical protein
VAVNTEWIKVRSSKNPEGPVRDGMADAVRYGLR